MVDNVESATKLPTAARAGREDGSSPGAPPLVGRTERLPGRDGSPVLQGLLDSQPGEGGVRASPNGQSGETSLGSVLASLMLNPLSIAGGIIGVVSACLTTVFIAIEIGSERTNPYNGIVGLMLLPSALVLGMLMVPIGALLRRRRMRRRAAATAPTLPTFPVIDLNQPAQFRLAVLAAAGGLVAVGLIATAGVKGFEFGESTDFCGLTCHRVMKPEYVAYQSSTHARVPCASCHIGPGASWFVKAKLTGIGQFVAYALNTYPRPVPAPIESLRPSRDTCEQCHWPDRIYGDRLQVRKSYAADEKNSLQEQTMVFRVGGGNQNEGVHWHIVNEVWYLALDQARQNIGWVEVRRPDGSRQEFWDPAENGVISAEQIQAGKRRMDCVDCHNRAAHETRPYEEAVDRALANNLLDASIPHLKELALALGPQDKAHPLAEGFDTVKARLASLADIYQRDYPGIYDARRGAIVAAGVQLVKIYEDGAFDEMQVDSGTYTNNLGHQQEGTGCARCHGKLALFTSGQIGERISSRCDLCHYAPVTMSAGALAEEAPAPTSKPAGTSGGIAALPAVSVDRAAAEAALFGKGPADSAQSAPRPLPHAYNVNEKSCLACHGREGLKPVPVSHAGRTDDTCLLCHQAASGPAGR